MNPDTVNLLVVFCLAAIVTATALLLRVWRDVKQLDDDDVRVTLMVPERHDRRFCLRHERALNHRV